MKACTETSTTITGRVISFPYPFECDECKEEITCERRWMTHLLITNVKCKLCGELLREKYHLERHMLLVHRLHQCAQCRKYYTTKGSLLRHKVVHCLNPHHYECDTCHVKFLWKSNLEQHMLIHEPNPELKYLYICEKCGKRFTRQWNLNLHMFIHEADVAKKYRFECDLCDRRFMRRDGFQKHLCKIHHVDPHEVEVSVAKMSKKMDTRNVNVSFRDDTSTNNMSN